MNNKANTNRDFTRNNFGETQNLLVLFAGVMFMFSILAGIMNNIGIRSTLDQMANSEIQYTQKYIDTIKEFETKPLNANLPIGEFGYKYKLGNSPLIFGTVKLEAENKVKRWMFIDSSREMSGSADFRLAGSVLKYDNILGDRFLFSENGSPLVKQDEDVLIELDGILRILLYNELPYPAPTANDIIKIPDDRTLIQKISTLGPFTFLQYLFLATAIGILVFVLIRIYIDTKNDDKGNQPTKMVA